MESFDVTRETDLLRLSDPAIGAIVTFIGQVRDTNEGESINGLFLEHYPGMAEAEISRIIDEACQRWPLRAVSVIHRVGHLLPADQIVFVGVGSEHRGDAFKACEFVMDYLKTRAPFWKKEVLATGQQTWVKARLSDQEKQGGWK